jgi:hypothetical protein
MRNMTRYPALICLFAVLALPPAGLLAAEPTAPSQLPPAALEAAGGQNLQLLGYGRFRKLLWDVFDASLWVSGETWSMGQPFALEFRYARDFEGSDIIDGTKSQWEHLGYAPGQTTIWIERLTRIFPDVKKGDQLLGLHLPGSKTRFFHNGQPIGDVEDPEFGRAFFAIWLDEKTSQPTLRAALLGGSGSGCEKPTTVAQAEVKPCGGATMTTPSTQRPDADRS